MKELCLRKFNRGYYKINEINAPFGKLELFESFSAGDDELSIVTLDGVEIGRTSEGLLKFVRDRLMLESLTVDCYVQMYGLRIYKNHLKANVYNDLVSLCICGHSGYIDSYGIMVPNKDVTYFLNSLKNLNYIVRLK